MPLAHQTQFLSVDEYLALDKESDQRYEYNNGLVTAIAGSSRRHNTIAINITASLHSATLNTNCSVYASDVKVHIPQRNSYYYPDVVVTCEPEDDDYTLYAPCLLIEVLSDSTKSKDYLEKLLAYQSLPSVQTYLVVSQDQFRVDAFQRDENGFWAMTRFENLEDEIQLSCPKSTLSLGQIYQGIKL